MRWFLAWALLSGCYTVQIRTSPNQATVTTRGGMNVTAVREVKEVLQQALGVAQSRAAGEL